MTSFGTFASNEIKSVISENVKDQVMFGDCCTKSAHDLDGNLVASVTICSKTSGTEAHVINCLKADDALEKVLKTLTIN